MSGKVKHPAHYAVFDSRQRKTALQLLADAALRPLVGMTAGDWVGNLLLRGAMLIRPDFSREERNWAHIDFSLAPL